MTFYRSWSVTAIVIGEQQLPYSLSPMAAWRQKWNNVILGQVVSIERGRTLVANLIEIAGKDSGIVVNGKHVKLFPTPVEIVEADLNRLKTTQSRKQALIEFCKAVISNRISLEPTQDVEAFKEKLLAIKGIGPWTALYRAQSLTWCRLPAIDWLDSWKSVEGPFSWGACPNEPLESVHRGPFMEKRRKREWRGKCAHLWRKITHVFTNRIIPHNSALLYRKDVQVKWSWLSEVSRCWLSKWQMLF